MFVGADFADPEPIPFEAITVTAISRSASEDCTT
jgi:hypothetical protein